MNRKDKAAAQAAELTRLFYDEELSLKEIAHSLGISRQCVRARFVRLGIPFVPHRIKKTVDRDVFIRLYVTEKKTIDEITKELGISPRVFYHELKRLEIEVRPFASARTRYLVPDFSGLEIGDQMIVPFEPNRRDFCHFYKKAKQIDIKISVSRIDKETLLITRVK
jgi:predicted DNA-binding protein YlxM (UPF0122 family)